MFFKNLIAFKLTENIGTYFKTENMNALPDELSDKLWDSAFLPCGLHSKSSIGFVPPVSQVFTGDDSMVHAANGYMMFCVKTQKKVLPSSAVNEVFNKKKALLETEQGRKLSAKERRELKDNIAFELLTKALTTSKLTYAYIDVNGGFIVIDTSSQGVAEDVLSLLRKCLGSLACVPLNTSAMPTLIMTDWISNGTDNPDLIEFDGDAVLKSVGEDKSVIRCKNQELFTDEIQNHLSAGKLVTAISLTYDNRLSFTLDDTLAVKKLKFLDAVHADLSHDDIETPEQKFDADFAIMTCELTAFISAMIGWFGGLVEGV